MTEREPSLARSGCEGERRVKLLTRATHARTRRAPGTARDPGAVPRGAPRLPPAPFLMVSIGVGGIIRPLKCQESHHSQSG
jgi:hypothetical protein